jgi:hypothetical protein
MGFKLRPGTSLFGNVTFTPDEIPPKWLAVAAYLEAEVYLYDMNNLSAQPITLSSPDTTSDGGYYGSSIAFAGDKLIIGSPLDDDPYDSGSFYVYDLNDLSTQPIEIKPSDLESQDQYALKMAANADKIVIGADGHDWSGAVYVYDTSTLNFVAKLEPSDNYPFSNRFGTSVAIDGDKIVVGAPKDKVNGTSSGAAYVYNANDLSAQPIKLDAPDGASSDLFGQNVAIGSGKIAVGAYGDDDNGSSSGSVYVYNANYLNNQPTKLTAFDAQSGDAFGRGVAIGDDTLVVGAYLEDEEASNAGAAYVYDLNSLGTQPTKLTAFDGASNDYFSLESVSVNNGKVAIGSYKNRTVYIYDMSDLSAQPDTLSESTKNRFGDKVEIAPLV